MNFRRRKPASRRLKFGLKSALILILILSLPLAWFAGELKQSKFEAEFLKKLESEVEGQPFYQSWFEYEAGSGFANRAKEPKGPAWLRSVFGQNVFSRIEKLEFKGRTWIKEPSGLDSSSFRADNFRNQSFDRIKSLDLTRLTGLESFYVNGFQELEDLSSIDKLTGLVNVSVTGCTNFNSLDGIENSIKLKRLIVIGFRSKLDDVDALRKLNNLDYVNIHVSKSRFSKRANWDALADKPGLRDLRIRTRRFLGIEGLDFAEDLPTTVPGSGSFRPSPNLEALSIEGVDPGLENLECCQEMPSLYLLELKGSSMLKSLAGVEHCKNLSTLRIEECPNLEEIEAIARLEKLEWLSISFSENEISFPVVSSSLKHVVLRGMQGFDDLRFLGNATKLEVLDLSESDVRSLSGLEKMTSLDSVSLTSCYSLESLRGLSHLGSMTLLDLSDCRSLKNLDHIPETNQLEHVVVKGCLELDDVDGLLKLKNLKIFEWLDCPKLNDEKLKKIRERFPQLQEKRDIYDLPDLRLN
jgi:Leucine-rich repeat (LRR) protein